mgnify:CR=1 FL=1
MTAEAYEKTNQMNILSMAEAMKIERAERRELEVKIQGLSNLVALQQEEISKALSLSYQAISRTHGSSTERG